MPVTAILAIVEGALTILEQTVPAIQMALASGTITPAQQQAVLDRLNALRTAGAFSGPEWTASPPPA